MSYIYDPQGNITEINDVAQQNHYFSGAVIEPKSLYEYDALYRLLKATGREHNALANLSHSDFANNIPLTESGSNMRNYTQEYQYDELGNQLQMKSNGVWTRDYRYDFANNNYLLGHDLQSTTNTYGYDAHGNMTKMPHLQELKWDFADNLKEVILDTNGNTAYFVYDTEGNRVRKVVEKGNIIEERFYVGDYEVYRKTTNGAVDVERETLHINDDKQKVALIDSPLEGGSGGVTVRYQYTNHLDSASLELDETGDIISYEEYHPFGSTSYRSGRNEVDVSLKRYKYVHKELDNETGLYYYGARYYASWLAKFISVDPLQHDYPQLTPFNYAGNKPITYYDIDGMQSNGDDKRNQEVKTHTVIKDDTYSEIAEQYGVTVDELRSWNKWEDTKIPIGEEMNISNPLQFLSESSSFRSHLNPVEVLRDNTRVARQSMLEIKYFEQKELMARESITITNKDKNKLNIIDPILFLAQVLNLKKELLVEEINKGYKFQIEAEKSLRKSGQYVVKVEKTTIQGLEKTAKSLSRIKFTGKLVGGVGIALTLFDMLDNGVTVENSADLIMGGIGFMGPIGAVISLSYFAGKMMIQQQQEFFKDSKNIKGWMMADKHHM